LAGEHTFVVDIDEIEDQVWAWCSICREIEDRGPREEG